MTISVPKRLLSPWARERRRLDTGLCPRKPHFRLKQTLNSKVMEELCQEHRDEFIFQTTYEIDLRKYEHYNYNLKIFGNNANEILLQVIMTCTWAREHYALTRHMPDLHLPYMLWSRLGSQNGRCQASSTSPTLSTGASVGNGGNSFPFYCNSGWTTMPPSKSRAVSSG